ncbi:MAG: hypothetical protein A3J69_01420 [Candidatus Levybacteria bacterium RIFCSPHIGHO2_02_FULL_42_12]|nr:MAG: hypothetical protein A3J69_01420 [Candidatus Levybacteria bacterium RIFCSPHIGHO2_02_FULL_42_12]OGH42542.1 MAG: hypothetical protein A3B53_01025 [Candidatus Levybacteria bacterium RIFCSPLOWO2_01_FULL_42_15]
MSEHSQIETQEDLTFGAPNVKSAKIVSTPTYFSWSQAYSAGAFFAALSLTKTKHTIPAASHIQEQTEHQPLEEIPQEEKLPTLPAIGKEILTILEQEYFTLENKDLASIKQALSVTISHIPEDVSCCLVVASFIKNVLYLAMIGNGCVILKRGYSLGVIFSQKEEPPSLAPISASGFVQNHDIVILETEGFARLLPMNELAGFLDHFSPAEIAESLSPKVHEKEEGGASCIIVSFVDPSQSSEEEPKETENETQLASENQTQTLESPLVNRFSIKTFFLFLASIIPKTNISFPKIRLPRSQISLVIVACAIVLAIVAGTIFSLQSQERAKRKALFEDVAASAQKKYDEGQSLLALNKNVAREDFVSAKEILLGKRFEFPKESEEAKKLEAFLIKIDSAISVSLNNAAVLLQKVQGQDSPLLKLWIDERSVLFATEDNQNLYAINAGEVFSVSKKTGGKQTLIVKSDGGWDNPSGIGVFGSSIYLLDRTSQRILKFVLQGSSYTKSDYLSQDVSANFAHVSDMAIDGAIWVLYKDGAIQKFLRGKGESFTVSGLSEPFKNPTRIFTNQETESLYVLDGDNKQIIVLSKDGAYKKRYSSEDFKNMKAFQISEKEGKGFVTDGSSLFEFPLR